MACLGFMKRRTLKTLGKMNIASACRISNALDCGVCLQRFKEPRILQCFHTFCSECLQKLATPKSSRKHSKLSIKCPSCRQETKTTEVEKLAKNFILNDILDILESKASLNERDWDTSVSKSQSSLFICQDHREAASCFCQTCAIPLCSLCLDSCRHEDHNITSLLSHLNKSCDSFLAVFKDLEKLKFNLQLDIALCTHQEEKVKDWAENSLASTRKQFSRLRQQIDEKEKEITAIMQGSFEKELSTLCTNRYSAEKALHLIASKICQAEEHLRVNSFLHMGESSVYNNRGAASNGNALIWDRKVGHIEVKKHTLVGLNFAIDSIRAISLSCDGPTREDVYGQGHCQAGENETSSNLNRNDQDSMTMELLVQLKARGKCKGTQNFCVETSNFGSLIDFEKYFTADWDYIKRAIDEERTASQPERNEHESESIDFILRHWNLYQKNFLSVIHIAKYLHAAGASAETFGKCSQRKHMNVMYGAILSHILRLAYLLTALKP